MLKYVGNFATLFPFISHPVFRIIDIIYGYMHSYNMAWSFTVV